MDKLLTYPGKQPLYLGDIDFMQNAIKAAVANMVKAYAWEPTGNAILYGCELRRGASLSLSWSAGIIAINGEILTVEAGVIGQVTTAYFEIVSSTAGSRVFGDGQTHDCWQYRTATITATPTDYPVSDFRRVIPVDTTQPAIYTFDGIVNNNASYAKLVNCGGAWHLSVKISPPELVTYLVDHDISGLPPAELAKFSNASAPSGVYTYVIASPSSPVQVLPAVINWSVVGDKLHISIADGQGIGFVDPFAYEINTCLPIF